MTESSGLECLHGVEDFRRSRQRPDGRVDWPWQARSAPRLRHTCFLAPMMARLSEMGRSRTREERAKKHSRTCERGVGNKTSSDGLFCSG
jgi:hypothetical protein